MKVENHLFINFDSILAVGSTNMMRAVLYYYDFNNLITI